MTSDPETLAVMADRLWKAQAGGVPGIAGLTVIRFERELGILPTVYHPSWLLLLRGRKEGVFAGEPMAIAAGEGMLINCDSPVSARIRDATPAWPYIALRLELDRDAVAGLLVEGADSAAPAEPLRRFRRAQAGAELLSAIGRLMAMSDDPAEEAALGPLVRREILWRLLTSPLGPQLRHFGAVESTEARISAVAAYIRVHHAEALRVADLAAMAHMSVPTFHRRFKAVTTMSPVTFQKRVRLQIARELLLSPGDIAAIGYRVGYGSASQFSRDYRSLYGLPPGRHGAELRAMAAGTG
ncbi:AraC family transcriptional regulator [Pelagovum pacificum]|nr:AraC family transcriptional regulator [Pelagovum pacificum]QQA43496.1 AraC family transcriptional regulator [Pelagovum pacificum]